MSNQFYNQAYSEARTRLTVLIDDMKTSDLLKKLDPSPNSIGFLMRHIGDVELLFSKNVFHGEEIQVVARTVIDGKDNGQWTNFEDIKAHLDHSGLLFSRTIEEQNSDSWSDLLTTKEFGTKTKAEAFGRIISHTAYHSGQIALILKYGK